MIMFHRFKLGRIVPVLFFYLVSGVLLFSQDCNDLKPENLNLRIGPESTTLSIDRDRVQVLPLLDFANEAEVRYREFGSSNWISASGSYNNLSVPFLPFPPSVLHIFNGDFTLDPKFGGIRYEMQTRLRCSVSDWGDWITLNFNSYCGSEGLENQPDDIDAEQLLYRDPNAEQGRLSEDEGRSFFKTGNYQNQELRFQNLKPNTEYWFKCRARCESGEWTSYTPLARVKTHCRKPASGDLHIFSQNMGTRMGVSCARNAEQYEFRMRAKGTSNWISSGMIQNDNYTFPTPVDKGDLYEFQCRIECGGQWTEWSDVKEYAIPVQCPQPVFGEIGADQITDKTARFFCRSGHASGVTEGHFYRYREASGSNWTEEFTRANQLEVNRLKDNTDYVMQVQHECTNQVTGNWSGSVFFKTDQSCEIKSNAVSVQDISYQSALLKCSQKNRDAYTWELIRVSNGRQVRIPNQLTQNSYLVDSLSTGEEYQVRVKVICGTEVSEFTEPVYFTTLFCSSPAENEITVSDIENTSATFNYNGNVLNGLEWQFRQVGNSNWRKVYTNQNEISIESLVRNANYEFRLRVSCAEQPSVFSDWSAIKTFTTGCASKITRFSGITLNSIKAHASDLGADIYEFRYRRAGNTNWIRPPGGSETFILADGLMPDTEYEFQVRSICDGQSSDWSLSEFASTVQDENLFCRKVFRTEIKATQVTSTTADLGCSRGGVDAYVFRVKKTSETNWQESPALTDGFYQLINLTPSSIYQFQVKVLCGNNFSEWSDTSRFRTQAFTQGLATACPPPYLSDFYAGNIGTQSALLLSRRGSDGYQFRYRELNSSIWIEGPSTQESFLLLNGLKSGLIYEYQSRVSCNGFSGTYSESKIFTTLHPGVCAEVPSEYIYEQGLSATAVNIFISVQASLYQIRYKKSSNDYWTDTDTSSQAFFRLTDLEPGEEYVYQIRVLCPDNQISPYSYSRNFTTLVGCQGLSTQDLNVDSVSSHAALLSHRDPDLKQTYLFRFRERGKGEWSIRNSNPIFKRFLLLDSLLPETEYEFQVLVVCSEKSISSWSSSQYFKTTSATAIRDERNPLLEIYPNPARSYFVLKNVDIMEERQRITISDLQGVVLHLWQSEAVKEQKFHIQLKPGIYLLNVTNSRGNFVRKLMVE